MNAQAILALCAHLILDPATSLPGNLQPAAQGLQPVLERIGSIQREVFCIAEHFSNPALVDNDRSSLGRRLVRLRYEQKDLERELAASESFSANPKVTY